MEQLKRELADAEHEAATAAVLAMVETAEEAVPVEPVPSFVRSFAYGPTTVSTDIVLGRDEVSLDGGGVEVQVKAVAGQDGGYTWMVLVVGRCDEVPIGDFCHLASSWEDAVRWGRRMFAKWSADVVRKHDFAGYAAGKYDSANSVAA